MPRTLDETAIRDEICGRSIRESFWVLTYFLHAGLCSWGNEINWSLGHASGGSFI
jgi:hypothetical protein